MKDLPMPSWALASILILLCAAANCFGQAMEIVPPTPNAMKMTEYYSQRPGMYTGTANVSIPLYTIDFDGWELPLTLNYNATGIRTNEEASEVGLGWALNATGVISRTVSGGDDLFTPVVGGRMGYVYNVDPVTFELGYDWKTEETPSPTSYYATLAGSGPDTQPDIFNFNFFGYSGSFVLTQQADPAYGGVIKAIKLTENACSIIFNESPKTFTVITPDGYKGEFTVKERSTTLSASVATAPEERMTCCGENNIDINTYKNTGKYRTVTSWYLSRITSPSGQEINFIYDMNPDGTSPYLSNSTAFGELEDVTSTQTCLQTIQEHVYLQQILSEEVQVNVAMETREDLRMNTRYTSVESGSWFPLSQPLKRYSGITITGVDPSSTLHKSITFTQSYFNQQFQDRTSGNQNENEVRWMRSKLIRLTIDDQEYRFYYEKGAAGLPDKLTNGVDHFGFYNGLDENTWLLPPEPADGSFVGGGIDIADTALVERYKQRWERRVQFSYAKAGLLTEIKYPTRGYTIFEYEPHTYIPSASGSFLEEPSGTSLDGSNQAGGARIKSIKEFDSSDTLLLSKSYRYVENPFTVPPAPASPTTGRLMTPLYNRYPYIWYEKNPPYTPLGFTFVRTSNSSIPGNNSAEGKIIGYSRVHEIVTGRTDSYVNTYIFENRPNKVLPWNSVAVGYPNLNGQIRQIRNYSSSGQIVEAIDNLEYYHPIDSIKAISYQKNSTSNQSSPYLHHYVLYTLRRTFNTPYTTITTVPDQGTTTTEDGNGDLTYNGTTRQTQSKLYYDKNWLLRYKGQLNSLGDSIITRYRRPADYPSPSGTIQHMTAEGVNMVNPVIEEITYKNGMVIAASASQYNYDAVNNKVNLTASYSYNPDKGAFVTSSDGSNFTGPYEIKTTFNSYDPQTGKLLQYTGSDGVTHSFVWGYNNKLPVVHGTGIGYSNLLAAHNTASSNPSTYETTIRNDAATAGKQVTTYAFSPKVGVTKITDPNGVKNGFEYDSYGRLVTVRNNENKVVAQNKYHFKTLSITRILTLSSTSVNFGTFYDCLPRPGPQTITLSNSGEADITVTPFVPPSGFAFTWTGGTIYAGTSIDVWVYFTGGIGNYSGSVAFQSNNDAGTLTANLTANYMATGTTSSIQLTPNPALFTVAHSTQYVQVKNTGNTCFTLAGTSLVPDDQYIAASLPTITLVPTQTATMNVFLKRIDLSTSKTFTVNSNEFGAMATMSVDIERIVLTPSATDITFDPFTGETATQTFTIDNTGNTLLEIQNITGNNTHFSVSPTSFQLQPADPPRTITVTYNPTDFSPQDLELAIASNKTAGPATVTLHAQRTEDYRLDWDPSSQVVIKPTDHPNEAYLKNTGNVSATIIGATAMDNADFTVTYRAYSGGFWVTVNPNTSPVTLGFGQSLEVSVTSNSFASSAISSITVRDDRNNDHVLQLVKSPTP